MIGHLAAISISSNDIKLPVIWANNNSPLLSNILTLVYTALAAICIFFIVRGALLYVTHGSDPSSNKQARETILFAFITLAGSTVVFTLLQFVVNSLGGTR